MEVSVRTIVTSMESTREMAEMLEEGRMLVGVWLKD